MRIRKTLSGQVALHTTIISQKVSSISVDINFFEKVRKSCHSDLVPGEYVWNTVLYPGDKDLIQTEGTIQIIPPSTPP